MNPFRLRLSYLALLVLGLFAKSSLLAQTDLPIYDDALDNGWQNWSWATVDTASTALVHSGTKSIAVTASAWSALAVHHDALDTHGYSSLTFWINGGPAGGQTLHISASLGGVDQASQSVGPLVANTWLKVVIPLASLAAADQTNLTDIWFQEGTGVNQPTFYVDDITLNSAQPPSVVNITIDAKTPVRQVDPRMFGVNTAIWDSVFDTSTTKDLLHEMDNRTLRFPGGSASDDYHWATGKNDAGTTLWPTNFNQFADVAEATNAKVFITANYGSGTPEEAAAWVKYSNKTKHHHFQYWEIGNENYGTWEEDHNTRSNDPVTYATRFKEYYKQMKMVDSSIKIGAVVVTGEDSQANYADEIVTNARTGATHSGWTPVMLTTMKTLGVTPDFIIYHRYAQGPGGESDSTLLTSSSTWTNDATNLRQMLTDYLGAAAPQVELTCTENNSVYANPGKQTTSLVNGLFWADSLGNILQTEFNSLIWWDFRNGQETTNNNNVALYGWRQYGDYGIVDSTVPAAPADRYPTFYVQKLLKHYARGGETVITATSDYIGVAAYGILKGDGSLRVLLINKHPTAKLNAMITINGLNVGREGVIYSYGIPQDTAAQTGVGSADVQHWDFKLPSPGTFNYVAQPYSATIIRMHGENCPNDTADGMDN